MTSSGPIDGADGRARCPWVFDSRGRPIDDYLDYHDHEWGRPLHGDVAMFERVTLEAFQSGLSWLTILRKREAFRSAFCGFDPRHVAAFGTADRARLLADRGIVRNRAKIDATIANAAALLVLQRRDGQGALDRLVWAHRPQRQPDGPSTVGDVPAVTAESRALARSLKALGFRFVGPTTAYALMQATGVVNDHLSECYFRDRPG